MKFKVFDNKTGKEADTWNIALHEEWAQGLVYCDMEGFAITEDGYLMLADECGHVVYCDPERFKVVFEEERPHGAWIPVNERLPEEKINPVTHDFEEVLVTTIWGDVRHYKYGTPIGHDEAHFWYGFGIMDEEVIAWMPLPEPYMREGEVK